eukprot:CAMPEP_0204500480 /NCGR_PEP_ID=MMETSP0471-20130131/97266_1 /ASSEMBLY_ACC=CAM_ASM_000602 /TAXON_ID=2969 /ORGANISM="Oxyrrhis marina" /LENGTH=68 /DNA_ID=CAMNT_0051505103 /DNA_START=17 /DNA_END=224 /DNA_ORIENTATION=+
MANTRRRVRLKPNSMRVTPKQKTKVVYKIPFSLPQPLVQLLEAFSLARVTSEAEAVVELTSRQQGTSV